MKIISIKQYNNSQWNNYDFLSVVDDILNAESTSPVQNKVITEALNGKLSNDPDAYDIFSGPNYVLSIVGGVIRKTEVDSWGNGHARRIICSDDKGGIARKQDGTHPDHLTRKGYVDAQIQNVAEIAEGKTKTYVVHYADNPQFNNQAEVIGDSFNTQFTDINGVVIQYADLKPGDIILITETDVPDRWVWNVPEEGTYTEFGRLETAKIDLDAYALKTDIPTVDEVLDAESENPVQNKAIKEYVDNAVANVTVDIEVDEVLDAESINPVQNKVIKEALDEKVDVNAPHGTTATYLFGINGTKVTTTPFVQDGGRWTAVKRDDTNNVRSSAAPTRDDHLTNKLYVDETIQEAVDNKIANIQPWDETREYKVGDIVSYANGTTAFNTLAYTNYIAVQDNVGQNPTASTTYWSAQQAPVNISAKGTGGRPAYIFALDSLGAGGSLLPVTKTTNWDRPRNAVMVSDGNGNTYVGTPLEDTHAANKQYVDEQIEVVQDAIDDKVANIQAWNATKQYKIGDIVRCKVGGFERFYIALVDNVGVAPTQWGDTTWTMKNSLMPYSGSSYAQNSSVTSGYLPFANGSNDNFYLRTFAQSTGSRLKTWPTIVMTDSYTRVDTDGNTITGTGAILQDYAPTADNHLTNKLYVDEQVETVRVVVKRLI